MNTTTKTNQISLNYLNYFGKGISFNEYLAGVEKDAVISNPEGHLVHVPMNLQRMKRIIKTIQLSEEMKTALLQLNNQVNWLLISEHWCGDASQITPVINSIAEYSNGKINLKIVYRDQHPELIDTHLSNGARAIPILIQLNKDFELIGTWGPRPAIAQKLVKELKNNPETASTYAEHLHKWYAQDKQNSIQQEIAELIKKATTLNPS